MLCAWKTKTKAGTAVLELLLIACTLCIQWDYTMLCWQNHIGSYGKNATLNRLILFGILISNILATASYLIVIG